MRHEWPIVETEVAADLRRGFAFLVKRGWGQGFVPDGPVCPLQALWETRRSNDAYDRAAFALRKAIGCWEVMEWNDAPGRTFAQVRGAFLEALKNESRARTGDFCAPIPKG